MNLLRRVLWAVLLVAAWCFSAASSSAAVKEYAVIETSKGTLEVELWPTLAPRTVQNFKYLADTRFYDGTAFHRKIAGFMIQGGDPYTRDTANSALFGQGGPGFTIADEFDTSSDLGASVRAHKRGVISMAHSGTANSGGSQFFIMFGTAADLDGKYASFGKVTSLDPNDIAGAKNKATLEALEAETVVAQSDATGAEVSKPVNRLEVKTVRIRSEVSLPDKAAFKAVTYNGPLRGVNRSYMGMYNISVTSTGSFSGTVQYFGRTNKVLGQFVIGSGGTDATYSGTLNRGAVVPLSLEMTLRLASVTGEGNNVLAIQLKDGNANATDRATTMATGAAEPVPVALLSDRYNFFLIRPEANDGSAVLSNLQGHGYLSGSLRRASGLVTLFGSLADGTKFTASRGVVNEDGHAVLPLYDYQLERDMEVYRADFPNIPLAKWPTKMNKFRMFQLSGTLELPVGNTAYVISRIIWQREELVSGLFDAELAGYSRVVAARWVAPAKGQMLEPFSASAAKGRILVTGLDPFEFVLSASNKVTFSTSASSYSPVMNIDLTTGTYMGRFKETVDGIKVTRTFGGVLMPFSDIRGFGYSLDSASSKVVTLVPGGIPAP
ncbi:MAG: peptidylprolyl isomerase [Verrucomicrobiota bacterium]